MALVAGVSLINPAVLATASPLVLKLANALAFGTNVWAVSVPGRMDGDQDARMRSGDLNPNNASTPLNTTTTSENTNIVRASRERTLVAPAGWACES